MSVQKIVKISYFPLGHSFCIIGNPKWIGKPSLQPVENVSASILITWHGKIRNAKGNGRDCTDNFRIKYWPTIDSNNYTLTELLENTLRQFEIENLLPGTNYAFQVTKMYYYHIQGPIVNFMEGRYLSRNKWRFCIQQVP